MAEVDTQTEKATVELPKPRSNRPVRPVHYIELAFMRAFLFAFRIVGVDAASFIAGKFLRYVGPLIRPVSKRAENNISMIFPEWPKEQLRAVTRDLWENLGRTAGEFASLDVITRSPPNDRLEIVGLEKFQKIIADNEPALFITGHFANWEVTVATLQQVGLEYAFVYRAANNPLTDELIIHHRAKAASRHQIPKDKRGNRAQVETLAYGRSLLLLVDQKVNTGISAPFLGCDAMTGTGSARIALRYNAPIYFISLERLRGARFRLTVNGPLAFSPTGNRNDDIDALTRMLNDLISDDIRARPAQWLWFHRRWPKK